MPAQCRRLNVVSPHFSLKFPQDLETVWSSMAASWAWVTADDVLIVGGINVVAWVEIKTDIDCMQYK